MGSHTAADNEQGRRALLENSRLFRGFAPRVLDAIIPLLSPCRFEADSLICLKGDESDCLYIVREGEAEVTVSSSDGRIVLLGILGEGDVFGEVGLLDRGSRTANVSARTDVSLYRLDSGDFDKITALFGVDEFMALSAYICFLFRGVANNLEDTVFMDAGVRIARKIQILHERGAAEPDGEGFSIGLSQETLGRMAGLSREATNKALAGLEDKGLIRLAYKKIIVPDAEKFRKALPE